MNFSEKEKESEVQEWLVEESVSCNSDPAMLPSKLTLYIYFVRTDFQCLTDPSKWQVEYFKTLQLYYSLRLVMVYILFLLCFFCFWTDHVRLMNSSMGV